MAAHKSLYIPDASVLLKWVVKEKEWQEEARAFRSDFLKEKIELIVPPHCYSEICNMLGREYRNAAVSFISQLINSSVIEQRLTFSIINIAFRLIHKYEHITFYDASYHALALDERGIFLTADKKYYRKTHREGAIMLLKDYGKKRHR